MNRATWYPLLMNIRAALERRGKFIDSDNLLKGVYRCSNEKAVRDLLASYVKRFEIPERELGDDNRRGMDTT